MKGVRAENRKQGFRS